MLETQFDDGDITLDELQQAFRRARMRFAGYGFMRALETPCVHIALRAMARGMRKQHHNTTRGQEKT